MDRELSEIFKELVVNGGVILPDLRNDYAFSFQTVFHSPNYLTYCCCTCAFEHEYFDYIDESGNINQDMLDKIVESIRNGACPHVDMVPEEFVTETRVNGLHVVAATGSEEQVVWYLKNVSHKAREFTSKVFGLQPYLITLLKNKSIVMNTSYNILRQLQLQQLIPAGFKTNHKLLYAQRSAGNCQTIMIKRMSISDVCVQKRSTAMLKFLFKTTESQTPKFLISRHFVNRNTEFEPGFPKSKLGIARVYEMAYRQGLVQGKDFISVIHELFVRKLPRLQYKRRTYSVEFETELEMFIETIIVCDQPEVLDCLFTETGLELKCRCSILAQNGSEECSFCNLNKTCLVLGRTECERVIERHRRTDLHAFETSAKERNQNTVQKTDKPFDSETIRHEVLTEESKFTCESNTVTKRDVDYNMAGIEAQTDNKISVEAKIKNFVSLLKDHPYSKDDIKKAFKTIPNLWHAIKVPLKNTIDHICINAPMRHTVCHRRISPNNLRQTFRGTGPSSEDKQSLTTDIDILRTLIDVGANINNDEPNEPTILKALLDRKSTYWPYLEIEYRQILELFLYANPSVDDNRNVVAKGLKVDINTVTNNQLQQLWSGFRYHGHHRHRQRPTHRSTMTTASSDVIPWTYVMDAKEHFFFSENLSTVCFSFTGPLLIECGFHISQRQLQEALTDPHHPDVKIYLQQCQNVPRLLKHCCRDMLRKYCKGRKIHEFVNKSHIPGYIKDFILLKTVLHTI